MFKKIFIAIILILVMIPLPVFAAKSTFAADDPNIKYIGRWAKNETGFMEGSFGCGAIVHFTGSTLTLAAKSDYGCLYVRVDGGAYTIVNGSRRLARGLDEGDHVIEIYALTQRAFPVISGIELDEGGKLLPVEEKPIIEFIGDSILKGYTVTNDGYRYSYGSFTADNLGFYRNIVAFGGLAVTQGYGVPDGYGIVKRYSMQKEHTNEEPLGATWDHSLFIPDYIVVNLGTNDHSAPSDKFEEHYTTFLTQLRGYYKDAKIFIMTTFAKIKTNEIIRVYNACKDENMFLIESHTWNIPKGLDTVHPDNEGQQLIATKLTDALKGILDASNETDSDAITQPSEDADLTDGLDAPQNQNRNESNNDFVLPLVIGGICATAAAIVVIVLVSNKKKKAQK